MKPSNDEHYRQLLAPAINEARVGMAAGNMPCGGAIYDAEDNLIGCGHNTALTDNNPLLHGETAAFIASGFTRDEPKTGFTFVTTLSPCWYCAGMIRWFGFERVVIGDSRTFSVSEDWLRTAGIEVIALNDPDAIALMTEFIEAHPEEWEWPEARLELDAAAAK
jgi:cytosine/creatinine deaminase